MRLSLIFLILLGLAAKTLAASISEDFNSNPLENGWSTFGDASLFQWNPETKSMDVRWDSEKTNSCFFKMLPTVIHKDDDFSINFELTPKSVVVQFNQSRSYAFEVFAVGLISTNTSFQPLFDRTTGTDSPNLAEFDYFPDTGFRATLSPVLVSSNSYFGTSFLFPAPLDNSVSYQISMVYTASNQVMKTTVLNKITLQVYQTSFPLPTSYTDFALNALSITSYRDNDNTGSMLAQGAVRNIRVDFPEPPKIIGITNSSTQTSVTFSSRTNRFYTVEATSNLKNWVATITPVQGLEGQTEIVLPTSAPLQLFRVLEQKQ